MTENEKRISSDNRLQKARISRALFFVLVLLDIAAAYLLTANGRTGLPVSILWIIRLYLVLKYYQSDVSVKRYAGAEEGGPFYIVGIVLIVGLLTVSIITEVRVRGWFIVDVICYVYLLYFTVLNLFFRRPDRQAG